ncbi:hypothetical protein [Prosthecobacter sp.]|uniref:hypothetical protein n=1 Tax=Prosthecobacter sp. TaxID=1965333 RepID=UPI0037834481
MKPPSTFEATLVEVAFPSGFHLSSRYAFLETLDEEALIVQYRSLYGKRFHDLLVTRVEKKHEWMEDAYEIKVFLKQSPDDINGFLGLRHWG